MRILTLLLFVMPLFLRAQQVRFLFTNGSELSYPLLEVQSITLPDQAMNVNLTDGSTVGWSLSSLARVEYDGLSTLSPSAATGLDMRIELFPNPTAGEVTLRYFLDRPSSTRIDVLDLHGSMIRTLLSVDQLAGSHELRWDGLGANGQPLPNGSYFLCITSQLGRIGRLVLLQR